MEMVGRAGSGGADDDKASSLGPSVLTGPSSPGRWVAAVAFAIAVHAGAAYYLLSSVRLEADGAPDDAIAVEMMPFVSEPGDKPDDVAGPKVDGSGAATSEVARAEDPEPPAPDSPVPAETASKPETAPEPTAPPAATADAVLPAEKPVQPPTETKPDPDKTAEVRKDEVERVSAPSRASDGSVAQLEGGKRVSAAAKATWAGAVGSHLARLRRYPREARAAGWQGTARVRLILDGDGHVTDCSLIKSAGRSVLDEEALALVHRSDPLPRPPAGMAVPVALTVPVSFAIR